MRDFLGRYDWKGVALIFWPHVLLVLIALACIVAAWAAVPAP